MQYVVPDVLNRSPSIVEIMRSSFWFFFFFLFYQSDLSILYFATNGIWMLILSVSINCLFLVCFTVPVKLVIQRQ